MPVTDGIGRGKFTSQKHEHFRGLMRMHVDIARGALKQEWARGGEYVYIDLNAGCGVYDSAVGTPLIALKRLEESREKGLTYRACLIEREQDHCEALQGHVHDMGINDDRVEVLCGDNSECALPWCDEHLHQRVTFGLILHDPNGVPDFELVARLASHPRCKRFVDVAVYLSATTIKRVRNSGVNDDTATLIERITAVQKQHWLIRQPSGADQWTFLIGTNWKKIPEWASKGFYRLESDSGRAALERLSSTANELRAKQQLSLMGALNGENASVPDLSRVPAPPAVSSSAISRAGAGAGMVRALSPATGYGGPSSPLSAVGDVRRSGKPPRNLPQLPL